MATYIYTARSRQGEKTDGTIEANDRRSALMLIERMGYIPVSVTESSAAGKEEKKGRFRLQMSGRLKMGSREVLIFTTELSDLLASGMTLGNALNCLSNRKTGRPSDKIIAGLRDEIIRGTSMSDAFGMYSDTFSNLYVSMIKAGEASGALEEVLRRLVVHYERVQDTKEKVVMAMVYPCIVMFMGLCTLIFAMLYVVPKFETIFKQMGEALPLPTRMLIGSSKWIARYGLVALAVSIVICVLIGRAVKTEKGQLWWHGFLLKAPLIRGVVASGILANFARTLGTLLSNGVPVLQALGIVERTVGNSVISREIRKARDRVTDGTTISGPLAAGKVFPDMMTEMLSVGEQTGDMSGALTHIARRYENELDRNIKIFTTALEPILIVVVAVMVGFVAIAILMAVFNFTNGLDV